MADGAAVLLVQLPDAVLQSRPPGASAGGPCTSCACVADEYDCEEDFRDQFELMMEAFVKEAKCKVQDVQKRIEDAQQVLSPAVPVECGV